VRFQAARCSKYDQETGKYNPLPGRPIILRKSPSMKMESLVCVLQRMAHIGRSADKRKKKVTAVVSAT